MSTTYEKLLENLNVVKWELKERNDPSLNLCIKYVKDAICDAAKLNVELEKSKQTRRCVDLDVCDCYD